MRRWAAGLLFVALCGCSAVSPFQTGPLVGTPNVPEPGPRIAFCYNKLKTTPEQLQEMAQKQCYGSIPQLVGTDYRMDDCPLMTPGRATFICKPPPKPAPPANK